MPFHHNLRGPQIHWPKKRKDYLGEYLGLGMPDEDWEPRVYNGVKETPAQITKRMEGKHRSSSGEHIKMQAHKEAVDQKARMAEFEATQQGAPQSFVKHGKPFAMSRYKDTSMFPAKSMPVSDPGRLQAAPVGYEKDPWWRQSPYVSPRQPGYSIFSMKPYSW